MLKRVRRLVIGSIRIFIYHTVPARMEYPCLPSLGFGITTGRMDVRLLCYSLIEWKHYAPLQSIYQKSTYRLLSSLLFTLNPGKVATGTNHLLTQLLHVSCGPKVC